MAGTIRYPCLIIKYLMSELRVSADEAAWALPPSSVRLFDINLTLLHHDSPPEATAFLPPAARYYPRSWCSPGESWML